MLLKRISPWPLEPSIVGWLLIWRDYPIFRRVVHHAVRRAAMEPNTPQKACKTEKRYGVAQDRLAFAPIEMTHAGDSDRQIGGVGELGMGGPSFGRCCCATERLYGAWRLERGRRQVAPDPDPQPRG
ncbi:hypothetical protein M8494_21825 [Serratia ureilytica]